MGKGSSALGGMGRLPSAGGGLCALVVVGEAAGGAVAEAAARVSVAAASVCWTLTPGVTVGMEIGPPPTAVTTTTIGVGVMTAVRVAFTAFATRAGSAEMQAVNPNVKVRDKARR